MTHKSKINPDSFGKRKPIRLIDQILIRISRINTVVLFLTPISLGLSIGLVWADIVKTFYAGNFPRFPNLIMGCLIFFLWGLGGFVWILRKEVSFYIISIHGTIAVVAGVLWIVVCWWLAFGGTWHGLQLLWGQ
jgi:hypothetical protein